MSVVVFIAIVFALAGVGVFAANKVHAKRIGKRDVPFLLEAYREIDAMGLNGPRMAPAMPYGDQRNGYLTPEQRLILAGQHPVEPAPVDPLAMATVRFVHRGRVMEIQVSEEVRADHDALTRVIWEVIGARELANTEQYNGRQALLANAPPPTAEQQMLLANAATNAWSSQGMQSARQQEPAPSYPFRDQGRGRLGRVANERYDRQEAIAAYYREIIDQANVPPPLRGKS